MSTHRERREARIERLETWAAGRAHRADAERQRSADLTAGIPFGQPILAGHHSERRHRSAVDRSWQALGRSVESDRIAKRHAEKAANIAGQLEASIYDDDPDAIVQLRARLEVLEAARDRIKRYNASCRKAAKTGGSGDASILDDEQRANLASVIRHQAHAVGPGGSFPSYALSNLSSNIKRNRDRLARLEAGA